MMFCENCGKQIPDDSVFCEECGAAVGGEAQAAPTYDGYAAAATPRKKKPVKKIIGLSALGLILIIFIVMGVAMLKIIDDNKPAITAAQAIQKGILPANIASVDLTGRWYMLMSYYTVFGEGEPPYILYKLQLDVKRNKYGNHDAKVTTLTARYDNDHKDYPGDGIAPPDISGKAIISGSGGMMYFTMREKSNPYRHAIDFFEWEVWDGTYIQSILFPLDSQQGEGELYPFGYLRSEDSENFYWK